MSEQPNKLNRLAVVAILMAIGVVGSYLVVIPIGIVRAFPVQHFLNIVTAVVVGPGAAIAMAGGTAILRILLGTGSILAIPGSLTGAILVGAMLRITRKRLPLCLAEVVGTGVLAPFLCVPIAKLVLGSELLVMAVLPSFFLSSLVGSILAYLLLPALKRRIKR